MERSVRVMLVDLRIEMISPHALKPWVKNARTHSKKQVRQIADSIRRFGFTNPILDDGSHAILAGHGRVEAAKLIGMTDVPCLRLPTPQALGESSYGVGYGKPPAATRFKPGQSGNPKGRPKGARNRMPQLNEERLKSIVMAEAYRTIKVNDGPRQVDMQVAQAVVRAISLNALKGHHRAQHLFAQLLGQTEASNKVLYDEWLNTALEYKVQREREIDRCKRLGLPEPDPVLHPDHIDLDMKTGQIVVEGPFTCKQSDAGRKLVEQLMEGLDQSDWFSKERKRTRDPERRARLDALIAQETKHRDKLLKRVLNLPWLALEWARASRERRAK
jgi:hypothetical protein